MGESLGGLPGLEAGLPMKGTFAIAWTEGQVRAPGGAAAQQVLPPDTEG
jgi:hypothetical protein